MTSINISLDPGAIQPGKATADSAAFDLHALTAGVLAPGMRILVNTGMHLALPSEHAALVCPRSGLVHNHGVIVLNAPGIVDADIGAMWVSSCTTQTHNSRSVGTPMTVSPSCTFPQSKTHA